MPNLYDFSTFSMRLPQGAELERVGLTLVFVLALVGANLFTQRQISQVSRGTSEQRLLWATWGRNAFWVLGFLLVGGIWASKIAGFVLSVAALAAAILVVSKELLSCLVGAAYLGFARPFTIGDHIEVAGHRGQALSTTPFATTLLSSAEGNQITGRTVAVPNALFLVQQVINHSATGAFAMYLTKVAVPSAEKTLQHEEWLLSAANEVCQAWQEAAQAQFVNTERIEHMDLPSGVPRVLFDLADGKQRLLILRFACPPRLRVRTEQSILKAYLRQVEVHSGDRPGQDKPED